MAVSGSEKTQIGRAIAGVGRKQTFTAKDAGGGGGFVPFPKPRGTRAGIMNMTGGKQ